MSEALEDDFTIIVTEEQLYTVAQLATEQMQLEDELESAESKVKEIKQILAKIQQGLLPDILSAAGLSEFRTVRGDIVKVKEDLSVSVPKAKLNAITEWLEENNHGDVITGKVSVDLPKNSHNERAAAVQALLDAGLEPIEEFSVNTMTLKSILKQHLAKGDKIDLAEFGAFPWRKSEIKRA